MKRLVAIALVSLAAIAGCDPYLYQQSVAPPGRTARLDPVNGFWGLKHYRLEVSKGIALALTCAEGGPCEKMQVVSDNPGIAEVRPASLAALQSSGFSTSTAQPAAAFVVIGKAPGTTRIRVSAKEGTRDVVVTVIAPPTAQAVVATPAVSRVLVD